MEAEFLSLGLDIIGLGVFNFEFGSITKESPVIKARTRQRSDAVVSACQCAPCLPPHATQPASPPHPA
jgi:hypothetical protein